MFQNVLLFIHLKMFKIGCMLNVIYCNKLCVACCSVRHRATTVDLVILMWITSCKISWVFTVNCTVMWACNVQYLVTNHTESQISQEQRAALPSLFTGGRLHTCSLKKCITHILSTLFSSTSVLFSCAPFGTKSYTKMNNILVGLLLELGLEIRGTDLEKANFYPGFWHFAAILKSFHQLVFLMLIKGLHTELKSWAPINTQMCIP